MVAVGVGQLDGLTLQVRDRNLNPDEPLGSEGDGKVERESSLLRKRYGLLARCCALGLRCRFRPRQLNDQDFLASIK